MKVKNHYTISLKSSDITQGYFVDRHTRKFDQFASNFITSCTVSFVPKNGMPIINNIIQDNIIRVNDLDSYTVNRGCYTLSELIALINDYIIDAGSLSVCTEGEGFGRAVLYLEGNAAVDFTDAPCVREIFKLHTVYRTTIDNMYHAEGLTDITRNLQNVQIYCSLLQASTTRIANSHNDLLGTITIEATDTTSTTRISNLMIPIHNLVEYAEFVFRNQEGLTLSLNCNFYITLHISSFEYSEKNQEGKHKHTSISQELEQMTNLLLECREADNDIDLNQTVKLPPNSYISRISILQTGQINNISEDQTIIVDEETIVIPKGMYTIDTILAELNCANAVFTLVTEGKQAFKLAVTEFERISFEQAQQLKDILGFDEDIVLPQADGVITTKYQLRDDNHDFRLRVNGTQYGLFVKNGNYDEDTFFNALLSAIKVYVPDCTMNKTEKYYEFKSSQTIEITVVDDFAIDKYYWSHMIKYRNPSDKTIIPRVGYFYYNDDLRFDLIQEYVEIYESIHNKDHGIKITYSDGVSKTYNLPQGRFTVSDFFKQLVQALSIDTYFDVTYYRSTVSFNSKNGVSAYFTVYSQIDKNLLLPTTASTAWISYVSNNYHKGIKRKVNGTITVKHKEDNDKVYTQTYNGTYTIYNLMTDLRAMLSEFIRDFYGVGDTNATLIYATPFGITMTHGGPFNKNTINLQFGGTLIDNKIIKFSDCTTATGTYFTKSTTIKCYWNENQNTHNINLGYTNLGGLKDAIIKTLKEKEYIDAVNPNIHVTVSGNTLHIEAPNSIAAVYQDVLEKEDVYDPVITIKPAGARIFDPDATIIITSENNTLSIGNYTYTVPSGRYDYKEIITILNNQMKGTFVFLKKETYYELEHNGLDIDGTLFDALEFTPLTSSLRYYYPDKLIYENKSDIYSDHIINLTNAKEECNIHCSLVEGRADNMLCNLEITDLVKNYKMISNLAIPIINQFSDVQVYLRDALNNPYSYNGVMYIMLSLAHS